MRAIIYRRVSTDEQKTGTGPQDQAEKCQAYAKRMGFDIASEIADLGISGAVPIADRPGGAELYRLVSAHSIDAVIATYPDRLSRDEWGIELPMFLRHCALNNVSLHFSEKGGEVRRDMGGRLTLTIEDSSAGEERKKNSERQRAGRYQKVRNNILLVVGPAPYGYRRVPLAPEQPQELNGYKLPRYGLVIDEVQAKVVRDMYRLFTRNRWSLRRLSLYLIEQGIPAPKGRWWRQGIRRILKSTRNLGEFVYAGMVVHRPDLAIIDRETWDLAQKLLSTNKANSRRNLKYQYLFRSRVQCICGRKMRGQPMHKGLYLKYSCTGLQQEHNRCGNTRNLNAPYVDTTAWEKLVKTLHDGDLIRQSARDYCEKRQNEVLPKRENLKRMRQERSEAEQLASTYIQRAGRPGIDPDLLARYEQSAQNELKRKKRLDIEIEQAEAELAHVLRYDEKSINATLGQVREHLAYGNPTFEQKRHLIELLNVTGQIEGEEIHFKLEIGITFSIARSLSPVSQERGHSDNVIRVPVEFWICRAAEKRKAA